MKMDLKQLYLIKNLIETDRIDNALNIIDSEINLQLLKTKTTSKFNILDYVAKDELRPQMEGVFYDESGYMVASDGHILVAIKTEEESPNKGKIIDKTGAEITDKKYPNWQNVIPTGYKDTFKINENWMQEILVKQKELKAQTPKNTPQLYIDIDSHCFDAKLFIKFLVAAKEIVATQVLYNPIDNTRAILAETKKGKCILMPVIRENLRDVTFLRLK